MTLVYEDDDYLGKAAEAGHAAKLAQKANELDTAWSLVHRQKEFYALHAKKCNWKQKDVLCLDGSVSHSLANILRLENKHDMAFVHILYWIVTSRNSIKDHDQKLKSYFSRCKFSNVSIEEVKDFFEKNKDRPDFIVIQSKVHEWRQRL